MVTLDTSDTLQAPGSIHNRPHNQGFRNQGRDPHGPSASGNRPHLTVNLPFGNGINSPFLHVGHRPNSAPRGSRRPGFPAPPLRPRPPPR